MALTRPKYSNIVDTDYKQSVRAITTTNITLTGGAPSTYDGLTLAAGDRILVNAQSTGSQNGIYIVSVLGTGSNGTWIRSVDASTTGYITAGMRTYVAEGTYAGTEYRLVTPDPITLGTTSLSFQSTASTVSGTNKSVQYNNAGFIAGATSLVYDNTTGNIVAAATTASTTTDTGALVTVGGVGIGGRLNVSGVAVFNSNVVVVGNLTTLGNTFITNTTDLSIQDSIINIHTPADLTPLVTNDGLDIGFKFHYYDTADSAGFLGRDNPTGYLVWEDKGTDTGGVFTGTSLGTFKVGNILLTGNTYRGTSTIGTAVQTHAIAYTTTSATPPTGPQVGDQWYDTSTDTLYEWIFDGTTGYWVDKLSQPVAISFATQSTAPIGPKSGDYWYDTSTDTLYTRVYDGSSYYWVDFSSKQPSTTAVATFFSSISIDPAVGNIVLSPTTVSTSSTTGALVVAGGIGVVGNVYVGGNIAIDGGQMTLYDSIIDLHTYGNLSPWPSDDGKDIGVRMHYYNSADKLAFMGLENSSKTLQFLIDATEVTGNVSGTYGNVRFGSLFLSNTTASTSTTTGALIVAGGVGVAGAVNASSMTVLESGTGNQYALTMKGSGSGDQWAFTVGSTTGQNNITSLNSAGSAYAPFSINGSTFTVGTTGAGATTSLSIDNAGNLTVTSGNILISSTANLFIGGNQTTNGPAFSAYANNTLQTITSGSQQKVLFQVEEYDTNNNFSSSRFTPTVAGYYQLNAEVRLDGASGTGEMMIVIWKNGSEYKRGTNQSGTQIATNFFALTVSSLVYANGTSDYFEIYVQQGSGGSLTVTAVNAVNITWFNGCMLRGA